MGLRFVKEKSVVNLVGESHTLPFRGLLCHDQHTQRYFLPDVKFLGQLKAGQYLSGEGTLAEPFQAALQMMGILGPDSLLTDLPRSNDFAALVLFAGDIDLHLDLFAVLDQDYDYELPGQTLYPVDPSREAIPFAMMDQRISEIFKPFITVVQALKHAGCKRLMVHALPPRCTDVERSARWSDDKPIQKLLRAKITHHANMLLAKVCAEHTVPFIDIADAITTDGYLRPEYDLDGVHVTPAAAEISFARIIEKILADQT